MSHLHTRKTFFAKLLGLIAAAGIAPKLLAKSASTPASPAPVKTTSFQLEPDRRAIARSGDSL